MDIDTFLHLHGISLERHAHPAVMTCAEADLLVPRLPGARTKNLFLYGKKSRKHLLVTVPSDSSVDLARLGVLLGLGKLSLASSVSLAERLGVSPGAVSLLALFNDKTLSVELVIDRSLWEAAAVLAHPLENTSTVIVPSGALVRFLAATGHVPRVIDVPVRKLEGVMS
jgi:Ala-tRNA(Pro) deacylase